MSTSKSVRRVAPEGEVLDEFVNVVVEATMFGDEPPAHRTVSFGEFAAGWVPSSDDLNEVTAGPIEGHLRAMLREAHIQGVFSGDILDDHKTIEHVALLVVAWTLRFCEAAAAAGQEPAVFAVDGVVAGGDPFGPEEPPE